MNKLLDGQTKGLSFTLPATFEISPDLRERYQAVVTARQHAKPFKLDPPPPIDDVYFEAMKIMNAEEIVLKGPAWNSTCAEVWILHTYHQVIVTDQPDPPALIIIGEYFDPADHFGPFELPVYGWGKADQVAKAKAAELGYDLCYETCAIDDEDWENEEDE